MKHLPFNNLRYCSRCCIPETQENVDFDEMGICLACQSQEQKIHINWSKREKILKKFSITQKKKLEIIMIVFFQLVEEKNSTFQMHVLTKSTPMKPLLGYI